MRPLRIAVLALASGLAISALTAWYCLRQEEPAAIGPVPSTPAVATSGRAAAENDPSLESLNAAPSAPAKVFHLSFDAEGKPVPDDALRGAFDYYLLEIGGDKGLRELLDMTGARASAAETKATGELAGRYVQYMRKSDAALAATGLVPDSLRNVREVEACADWLKQRERLQRETLGESVALAMFGNDNLLLNEALAQLRTNSEDRAPEAAEAGGIHHPAHAAVTLRTDTAGASHVLDPALRSFSDQALTLRAWRTRYDEMLSTAERKHLDVQAIGRPGNEANDLLREFFPLGEDRERALLELSRR